MCHLEGGDDVLLHYDAVMAEIQNCSVLERNRVSRTPTHLKMQRSGWFRCDVVAEEEASQALRSPPLNKEGVKMTDGRLTRFTPANSRTVITATRCGLSAKFYTHVMSPTF